MEQSRIRAALESMAERGTAMAKRLPVGIENFKEFITQDFYYVDKTMFIVELLKNWGKVNLFTRPRRFGKSLNMNMLKAFFEIGCDKELFDGLKISQEKELCGEYMGKFPVISVTLKGVGGLNFEASKNQLKMIIGSEAERFGFLEESDRLTENDKEKYRTIIRLEQGCYGMADVVLENSIYTLSQLLRKHYGCKTIVLIDEYDVPLDQAFQAGYYDEMVSLLRSLFGNVLKSNEHLKFAILTGCLRISKESIFTGLNNLNVMTVTDSYFSDCFGFTDSEVRELLEYYGLSDAFETVRNWYDGYRFGETAIYCPWDVIKYVQALLKNKNALPENYWANTSGNAMVRRFIGKADRQTRSEIERLIAGESIVRTVNQELTYNELDNTVENLWSVLFSTGYLTQRERLSAKQYRLAIPNLELVELFSSQIREWFRENTRADAEKLEQFCLAFPKGDFRTVEKLLKDYLWNSISIRDTAVRKEMKENFYHGMLLGLLQYENNWEIDSNAESGEGYCDILVRTPERVGIVIEIKYAEDGDLEKGCDEAFRQIEEKQYDAALVREGMEKIIKYGIAFFKKNCRAAAVVHTFSV